MVCGEIPQPPILGRMKHPATAAVSPGYGRGKGAMRLPNGVRYALHALVHLAGEEDNQPVASHRIARQRGIPEKFLHRVLKPLTTRGILRSVKGPNGGYRLAKTP